LVSVASLESLFQPREQRLLLAVFFEHADNRPHVLGKMRPQRREQKLLLLAAMQRELLIEKADDLPQRGQGITIEGGFELLQLL
jgi:hypothetical protein